MEHIDKKKLAAEINVLSLNGEVRVTAIDISGQDDYCARSSVIVHLSLAELPLLDAVIQLPVFGATYQELYISIIQTVNEKLGELANLFKANRLKPKLRAIPSYEVCAKCGGTRLYNMEFRTDYAVPRLYDPINTGTPEIRQEDTPYRMGGAYCMDCNSFCETTVHLGKMPGTAEEENDDD